MRIFFISIVIVFGGCGDINIPYDLVIVNNTNDTVTFYFTGTTAYTQGKDSVISIPSSKNNYFHSEGKPVKNACDYNGIYPNEVRVVVSRGKSLMKEISDLNNWQCQGSNKSGWVMTFVINDGDLRNISNRE